MKISALVLAAGRSLRMGTPKMLLPWGDTTVLGQVLGVLRSAGVQEILVVVGADREAVLAVCSEAGVQTVVNPAFPHGEMLSSLQAGLRASANDVSAALIALGDQPQIEADTVSRVMGRFRKDEPLLVVPSHKLHRGHPWLIARPLWPEVLQLSPPLTPRDFLGRNEAAIAYVEVDTPSILADLDTPKDYESQRP